MIHEYGHQSEAKKLLGKGDFVYFKDLKDGGRADIESVNSGIVSYVDDTNIDIDDVNGDGDNITRRLDEIVLCYDSEWDSEEDDQPAAEPMRCPVCKSEKTYWRDRTEEETYDGRQQPIDAKSPKMPPFIEKKERTSRAKYHPTEIITSIDALMNEKIAYFNGKLLPRAFFQNWQIHTARTFIKGGMVRYAKLKEGSHGRSD